MPTVTSCTSLIGYDKIQSLIIFATVIEVESAANDESLAKPKKDERDIPNRLCSVLCHLIIAATSTDTIINPRDPSLLSSRDVVENAKRLFQRAITDSEYVFAGLLWKSFIHVAKTEKVDDDTNDIYKVALVYAQYIYDMVPSSKRLYEDTIFFKDERDKLLGDMSSSDLQKWLNDTIGINQSNVASKNESLGKQSSSKSVKEVDTCTTQSRSLATIAAEIDTETYVSLSSSDHTDNSNTSGPEPNIAKQETTRSICHNVSEEIEKTDLLFYC